jgi:hypothetical protein
MCADDRQAGIALSPRYLPEDIAAQCRDAFGCAGLPREGLRRLAIVELARVGRQRSRPCLRPRRARDQARRQGRHHRRQPAPSLLGFPRRSMSGRGRGSHLPGFDRRGSSLRARSRRDAGRGCGKPGAGGQAVVGQGPVSWPRVHHLLGPAGPRPVRRAVSLRLRTDSGARPRLRRSRFFTPTNRFRSEAAPSTPRTPNTSSTRWPRARGATCRSSLIPPGPPAGQRASC